MGCLLRLRVQYNYAEHNMLNQNIVDVECQPDPKKKKKKGSRDSSSYHLGSNYCHFEIQQISEVVHIT